VIGSCSPYGNSVSYRKLEGKSRMSGDVHVRFRESGGVQFLSATRLVIVCRGRSQAREAMREVQAILGRLKLTLHPDKTRIVKADAEGFEFLGFYVRKIRSYVSGRIAPLVWPSAKSLKRIRRRLKELTCSRWLPVPLHVMVLWVNRVMRGWRQYFACGNGTRQFQALDRYLRMRLWRFYRRRAGNRARVPRALGQFRHWIRSCGIERFYHIGMFSRVP
jgi:RNA-directed DNA polymerase